MKSFQETFPSFDTEGELQNLWNITQVERVVAPPDMRSLKIYLSFPFLTEYRTIRKMERQIKEKLFPEKEIQIEIIEHFQLSGTFTPESLFAAYRDSIFQELKERSMIQYRMLVSGNVRFEKDVLSYDVPDTEINHHLDDGLRRFLTRVFNDRCGIHCEIRSLFYQPTKGISETDEEYAVPENMPQKAKEEDFIDGNGKKPSWTVVLEENVSDTQNTKSTVDKVQPDSRNPSAKKQKKKPSNPEIIFGRDFTEDFTPICEIQGEMGNVAVRGQVCDLESRHLKKNDLELLSFTITDYTDSIRVKLFLKPEERESVTSAVTNGAWIKLYGLTTIDSFDPELIIASVRGIKKGYDFRTAARMDHAKVKRVELHCHTKMSENDGVSNASDIIQRVADWGMDAIAITDHGNVQAFPEAFHKLDKLKDPKPKILYGVEAYLVDDLKDIIVNPSEASLNDNYVVFDLETTGLSSSRDKIIEIGAVKISDGKIVDRFSIFVNPGLPIPYRIQELTGIQDHMVKDADPIETVLPEFLSFCSGCALVAHNASFDTSFVRREAVDAGYAFNPTVVDTMSLARLLLPQLNKYKLDAVAKALEIRLENHHRAVDDAECTAGIFLKMAEMLRARGISRLSEISSLTVANADLIKKLPYYHAIILVQNEIGRINLYRLISYSHIDYYQRRPRIPKSVLTQYREGLILGSACEAGELYRALLTGSSDEEVKRIVDFYDYLEIQPLGNNLFLLHSDEYHVTSEEDLQNLNREVVRLGEQYDKPVVATCDVHFLNPEDEIYRRVLMHSMGYPDADRQPPLYLRTTDEMLEEFAYLGPEKAFEVVVTNTRKIADRIDNIAPVRPDKCPPVIENSDEILTESCYAKAHEQYGDILPELVEKRLEKELHSIITNGFAVMYIIAKRLVEKSNSDGYLVGSRGSVGSSFAAYTSGITEVNPLPAHYYCSRCKYSDFDSETVKQYTGMAGCDMPDKICPVCGEKLKKDGYDIPFETFLGFKGDKEPDIDLNFSGEYQPKAHAYTEVLFGKGHTFRAGTVGTIADKTAYGYVKKYFEEHGVSKRKCEINRLLQGCIGVKRTTGQHPGGIIVLPHGEEIYSFTPIQHPANDMTTDTITTHFEYHAIDHNLLKLDILGHQGPTMIRMLQDLTGIDPVKDIPFDSKETMQLFQGTQVLGISPEDIGGTPLGSLGIPEFGTDFAMQMLIDANPQGFSDLVRIAGLAHGTDVWIGNARDLIMSGQATIQTAICTRDDIMIYLIGKGLDPGLSFKIMEAVRKGKGLTSEWEEEMESHDVPQWYIDSCKKIKYMFPKAHAAAYVMTSWRIAYCKIFYPQAYYAAYFSIMGDGFDYELMGQGLEKLRHEMKVLQAKGENKTQKDVDCYRDMRIVEEMLVRGIRILPVDLYRSKGKIFTIEGNDIRPGFTSINGLGESVALQIEKAAKAGSFLSKEDFRNRAKVGKTLCDTLDSLGILKDLPESNQISLFDF